MITYIRISFRLKERVGSNIELLQLIEEADVNKDHQLNEHETKELMRKIDQVSIYPIFLFYLNHTVESLTHPYLR